MINIVNVDKNYLSKSGVATNALKNVSIRLEQSGLVFLLGKSGCGKTTLLNCISGLDTVDSGSIIVDNFKKSNDTTVDTDNKSIDLATCGTGYLSQYRCRSVGYVFQDSKALDLLTVGENIALAMELVGKIATGESIEACLQQVELQGYAKRRTDELSGGQKQRVALAMALAKECKIIVADEPTGNLDSSTGEEIWKLLKAKSKDRLIIVASHDQDSAVKYGDRVIKMKDGVVESDGTNTDAQFVANQADALVQADTKTVESKKSGLSVRHCIKFGWRVLVKKKLRMIFSILLPTIILAVFGVMLNANWFDQNKANLRQLYRHKIEYATMAYAESEQNTSPAYFFDLDKLDDKFDYYGVLYAKNTFIANNPMLDINAETLHKHIRNMSSNIVLDSEYPTDKNFEMSYGRLPNSQSEQDAGEYEIAIPDIVYDYGIKFGYKEIGVSDTQVANNFGELQNALFGLRHKLDNDSNAYTATGARVVGVVKTGYKLSDYYQNDAKNSAKVAAQAIGTFKFVHSLNDTTAMMPIITRQFAEYLTQYNTPMEKYNPHRLGSALFKLSGKKNADANFAFDTHIVSSMSRAFEYTQSFKVDASKIITYITIGLAAFAALLIANFISNSISSSKGTIGILRAMGASGNSVFGIYYTESVIVSLISSGVGFLLSLVLGGLLNVWWVGLFAFNILSLLSIVGLSIATTTLVVLLPILKISKKSPISLLKS